MAHSAWDGLRVWPHHPALAKLGRWMGIKEKNVKDATEGSCLSLLEDHEGCCSLSTLLTTSLLTYCFDTY